MSSASGGEKPEGSDKGDGESSPATIRGSKAVFFQRSCLKPAHGFYERGSGRAAGNAGMMLLVEPVASGCESRPAGPGHGTAGTPSSPHATAPALAPTGTRGAPRGEAPQRNPPCSLFPALLGFAFIWGKKGVREASQRSGWVVMSGVCQQWEAKLPRQSSRTEGRRDGTAASARPCPCHP